MVVYEKKNCQFEGVRDRQREERENEILKMIKIFVMVVINV